MSEGNILIRCPGCGKAQGVVMAVGQQLQCRVCQTVFFAPVLTTDQLPSTPASEPLAAASPGAVPDLAAQPPAAADVSGRTAISETRQLAPESVSRSWRTDGVGIEPTAASAPQAEPLRMASRGSGTSAESYEPGEELAGGGRIWTVMTVLASLIVVVATSLVGIHFTRKGRQATPEQTGTARPAPAAPTVDPAQVRWTDASQRAQRLGSLELKIVRAKYGAVRAKDVNNEVITTDDSNLLAVTVSVHNRGARARAFRSWYAGGLTDEGGGELLPELWDDEGRSYDLLRFDDVSSIEGQQLADEIEPRHDVQDTVVFLLPADVDRTKIRCFRLSLPAHAIGTADFFRFEIPVGIIVDF